MSTDDFGSRELGHRLNKRYFHGEGCKLNPIHPNSDKGKGFMVLEEREIWVIIRLEMHMQF